MFFVVYATDIGKHFIIPEKWIFDLKMKNHVNRSLNKNLSYRCYWTSKPNSRINGIPNPDFEPNFQVDLADHFPCFEGCFICHLVFCGGKRSLFRKYI